MTPASPSGTVRGFYNPGVPQRTTQSLTTESRSANANKVHLPLNNTTSTSTGWPARTAGRSRSTCRTPGWLLVRLPPSLPPGTAPPPLWLSVRTESDPHLARVVTIMARPFLAPLSFRLVWGQTPASRITGDVGGPACSLCCQPSLPPFLPSSLPPFLSFSALLLHLLLLILLLASPSPHGSKNLTTCRRGAPSTS